MGILSSSSGGEDSLQVGIAVFCIVVSLVITAMVPAIVPEYDAENPDFLSEARQKMENFTGESMITNAPWQLTSVRTPYTADSQEVIVSEYGWVYGSITPSYSLNGVTYLASSVVADPDNNDWDIEINGTYYKYTTEETIIKLDPDQKSFQELQIGEDQNYYTQENKWYFASNPLGDVAYWVVGGLGSFTGLWETDRTETVTNTGHTFDFTGQLYHFDPTYRISTQNSSATKLNSDMASLNVIWYDNGASSGISSGLVLQSDKSKAIIANYSTMDIISSAQTDSKYATKYLLNFDGIQVYMYIMFDTEVLTSNMSLLDAWNQGLWTISFASPSADGLMDIFNSNDLSSSLGNLIDTYLSIFTFDMPNCPAQWNLVLWVVCVLPLEIAMIMFLSRFGVLGILGGVLANALGFLGGIL